MPDPLAPGTPAPDITVTDTPYLQVATDRLEANLAAMAVRASRLGVDLRPHAKTHKCLELARLQIDHGAVGLTVATIGEAEVFAAAAADIGCRDLFLAYPVWVTPHKGARLRALARDVAVRVGIDSAAAAVRLGAEVGATRLAVETGTFHPVTVVVEVDSGQHRTGVVPEQAGVVAGAAVDAGLDVVGVFTFPGHGYGPGPAREVAAAQEAHALGVAADALRARGIEPTVISGGSTPTARFADAGVLTELRPGVYPFQDAQQVELGTCDVSEVALTAVTTVVHRTGHRVVVDAGSKVLGADRPAWASGFGRVPDVPDAVIVALSEHHAVIEYPVDLADGELPEPGAVITVIPNHVCSAVNLADVLVLDSPVPGVPVADAAPEPVSVWRVAARCANR
ncbi:alanine racemase [Gordonia sp. NPDC003376]